MIRFTHSCTRSVHIVKSEMYMFLSTLGCSLSLTIWNPNDSIYIEQFNILFKDHNCVPSMQQTQQISRCYLTKNKQKRSLQAYIYSCIRAIILNSGIEGGWVGMCVYVFASVDRDTFLLTYDANTFEMNLKSLWSINFMLVII